MTFTKVEVKFNQEQTTKAQRERRGTALLFLELRRYVGRVVNTTPRPLYPLERDPVYPLHRTLGGPHVRSGSVWKISPPPKFDPQTVQPVASRYNDY